MPDEAKPTTWLDIANKSINLLTLLVTVFLSVKVSQTHSEVGAARELQVENVQKQETRTDKMAEADRQRLEKQLEDNTRRLLWATWQQLKSQYEWSGTADDGAKMVDAKKSYDEYVKKHPNGGK